MWCSRRFCLYSIWRVINDMPSDTELDLATKMDSVMERLPVIIKASCVWHVCVRACVRVCCIRRHVYSIVVGRHLSSFCVLRNMMLNDALI